MATVNHSSSSSSRTRHRDDATSPEARSAASWIIGAIILIALLIGALYLMQKLADTKRTNPAAPPQTTQTQPHAEAGSAPVQ